MSQPKWKFFANLGDENLIDEGGRILYVDETGVYVPEIEVLEVFADRWETRRILVEPCTFENSVLSDNSFHKDHPAWFADGISRVASFVGKSADELVQALCGTDIVEQAKVYLAISDYYGIENFDDQPHRFTDRKIIEKRYADCK